MEKGHWNATSELVASACNELHNDCRELTCAKTAVTPERSILSEVCELEMLQI